tara:strand:- start:9352 stop:9648 length:297 start_codon:yes stop_codon:yes gene_type:complete
VQNKTKNFSRNNKKTTLLIIKKIFQQKHQHPTQTHRTPQQLNQTHQNTDSHMCVLGGGGSVPLSALGFRTWSAPWWLSQDCLFLTNYNKKRFCLNPYD